MLDDDDDDESTLVLVSSCIDDVGIYDDGVVIIALRLAIPSSFLFLRREMVVSVRRRRPSRVSIPFLKSFLRELSNIIGQVDDDTKK